MSKASKRKRSKATSLTLEDVMTSSVADEVQTLENLNKLQGQIAEVDVVGVMSRNTVPDEMVMLWLVAKIGFSNAVLLQECINKVPKAMAMHRRKYILEEFIRCSSNTLPNAEVYINLMLSCGPYVNKHKCKGEPTMMQRLVGLHMCLYVSKV